MMPRNLAVAAMVLALCALALPSHLVTAQSAPAPVGFAEGQAPRERLSITTATSGASYPLEAFDAYKVQFYDINGDGRLEIISHNDNNRFYVFDSLTGRVLTELTTGTPANWKYRETSGIAIGDVRGNGRVSLVVGNTIGILTVFEFNPEKSTPDKFVFDRLWKKQLDASLIQAQHSWWAPNGDGPALDGAPALADVDGDGKLEIFAQSDNGYGQYVFNHDGSFRWGGTGEGNAYPILADLNGDGRLEVVFATDGGEIMVYDASTGKRHFLFDARGYGANPGSLPKAPAVLDLDGDGRKEIYFGTRTAVKNESDPDPEWYKKQHTILFGIRPHQDLKWVDIVFKAQPEWANPMVAMRPSAVDVNGDGQLDLVWFDWNTIGHKPGNWESTGPPNLFVLDRHGNPVWHTTTNTFFSSKDIAIADLTGDGVPEIIHVEGHGKWDGIAYRDLSGRRIGWFPAGEGVVSQAPLLVDLDGDGTVEIVTAVKSKSTHCDRPRDAGCNTGAIKVFETGMPWRAVYEDGNVWFNHALDRMTVAGEKGPIARGGYSVQGELLPAAAGKIAVRLTATGSIDAVRARVGDTGEWVNLTRDGDRWTGDLTQGDSLLTVAAYGGNAFAALTFAPDGSIVEPGEDDAPPRTDEEPPLQNNVSTPGLTGAAVVASVAAAAMLAARRRR